MTRLQEIEARVQESENCELDEIYGEPWYMTDLRYLLDYVGELKEQNKTLTSALQWYGKELNYRGTYGVAVVMMDSGDLARKTLKKLEQ